MIVRDSSGKEYIEVETGEGEHLRLTLVPASQAGYGTDGEPSPKAGAEQAGPRLPSHSHPAPDIDPDLYERLCDVARQGGTADYTSVFGDPNEARSTAWGHLDV